VKRYNYAPTPLALAFTALTERFGALHLRGRVAIVAAGFALLALIVAVELYRLIRLNAAVTLMSARAERSAAAGQVGSLDRDLERLRRIDAALTVARRTALGDVNDLVLLGNRLPAQTWLTRIHGDRNGTWAIEGRSVRVPEVGTALAGVQAIDPDAHVRLQSLARVGERAQTVRFALTWERDSP